MIPEKLLEIKRNWGQRPFFIDKDKLDVKNRLASFHPRQAWCK